MNRILSSRCRQSRLRHPGPPTTRRTKRCIRTVELIIPPFPAHPETDTAIELFDD